MEAVQQAGGGSMTRTCDNCTEQTTDATRARCTTCACALPTPKPVASTDLLGEAILKPEGSMAYVRRVYDVPAKRGARVVYRGETRVKRGTITSAKYGRIFVRMDGDKHSGLYHPTWEIEIVQPNNYYQVDSP
jgi:hypothetical protein